MQREGGGLGEWGVVVVGWVMAQIGIVIVVAVIVIVV